MSNRNLQIAAGVAGYRLGQKVAGSRDAGPQNDDKQYAKFRSKTDKVWNAIEVARNLQYDDNHKAFVKKSSKALKSCINLGKFMDAAQYDQRIRDDLRKIWGHMLNAADALEEAMKQYVDRGCANRLAMLVALHQDLQKL